jgi:hypothetical protein
MPRKTRPRPFRPLSLPAVVGDPCHQLPGQDVNPLDALSRQEAASESSGGLEVIAPAVPAEQI